MASSIRNVELVSVGTWAASTGVTKVTRADLESMLAGQVDGLVDHAPIKLGHVSPLNDELEQDLGDGAPAFGWVVPTGIIKNAEGLDTLVGDLIGMPAKLAEVAPTAYRRRSVEIAWNVKTSAGKAYPAVIVGIALLGASPPAVKGLADILALYTEAPAEDGTRVDLQLVDGLEASNLAVAMLTAARMAGATVETVDAMASAAGARDTASIQPPESDGVDDEPTSSPDHLIGPTKGHTMTDAELRAALALEADADVDAALADLVAGRVATPAVPEVVPAVNADGTPVVAPVVPVVVEAEPQLATLSAGVLADLQRDATWARGERRRQVLDGAITTGRIAPAERAHFAAAIERDEDGTTTLLAALSPRFPVTELGDANAANAANADKAFDQFESDVFGLDKSK